MQFPMLRSAEELSALVQEVGFLPFFANRIPGFSVEECTPPELWFAEDAEGPWEWKGPVLRSTGCAYGKLFRGKAGYVSMDWYPDFANYRRDGYDFDARYDDGLAKNKDKAVYDTLNGRDSLLSKELRSLCGYGKDGRHGFDGVMTRLQMGGYVVTADFVYQATREGRQYGWGVARYATPERLFGTAFTDAVYARQPQESQQRMAAYLAGLFPAASEKDWNTILG